jgi:uncharacterized protein with HEPN domain
MAKRNDAEIIEAILAEIKFIKNVVKKITETQFVRDDVLQHAIIMAILNIGELANSLSDGVQDRNPRVPWMKIIGMRHMAAHDYGKLEMDRVWLTVTKNVPELEKQLKKVQLP